MNCLRSGLLLAAAAGVLAATLIYAGAFNVAADVPHSALTYRVMEIIRDRSIAVRLGEIQVPALDDPALIAEGAKDYGDMCVACHLTPDRKDSEIRAGLYPQPPDLTEPIDVGPARMFWVIKHGIKMSAMPAWGRTHDDQRIWGIVAFLQQLPELTPDQYRALTDIRGEGYQHGHAQTPGHSHHHGDGGSHEPTRR
jgi:mono/diheme cytochrome c family protein